MGGRKMKAQDVLVERINNLCKEKRMTYYALSYASAVPMTTLMHIVDKSTVNPGVLTIGKLCEGFGITLKEFFNAPEFDDIERFDM
ncbi:MAG: helix-turn-helix transcriptional regulator [Lachnospiraceae bacterium]|jgi:transcriptional regulator with XRE-family HTH domain|nr:helix-turn-helix transcriptional regulator [Lachnospiraceae bacterium]